MEKEGNYNDSKALQDETTKTKKDLKLVQEIHHTADAVENRAKIAKDAELRGAIYVD